VANNLNIVKSATPAFVAGVASLPSDFIKPVAVYDDTKKLYEIRSIEDKAEDTADATQYYIPNNSQLYIFGLTPTGTVKLWYKGYPDELSLDADIPSEIPSRYHYAIPEIFVKAKYNLRNNRMGDYAGLMSLWEQVKAEIFSAVNNERLAKGDEIEDVYYDPQMSGGGSSW
jgi:hypothetical protein